MKKVTIEHILGQIKSEQYFHTTKSTICTLKMKNGFEVHGTSGVVNEADFSKEIGEKYAKERAINKLWELEGYLLQQRLHEGGEFYAIKTKEKE